MAYNVSTFDNNSLEDNNTDTLGSIVIQKGSPTLSAIQFTVGVLGNCLALLVLVRGAKKHKWSIFYRLVAALAATDLFGIVATTPVALAVYDNDLQWVGGKPLCDYLAFMLVFAGLSTLFIVAAMSIDRFVAVCFPYTYNAAMQKARVHVLIASVWLVAIIIACLPLFGLGHNVLQYPGTWCFFDYFGTSLSDRVYAYLYACLGILMIVLTLVLNVLVIISLAKNKKRQDFRKSNGTNVETAKSKRNDVYIMIFLAVLLIIFITCWTPLMVRVLTNVSRGKPFKKQTDMLVFTVVSLLPMLDPWVYLLLREDAIAGCIRWVQRCKDPQKVVFRVTVDAPDTDSSLEGHDVRQSKKKKPKHVSWRAVSIAERSSAFSNSVTVAADSTCMPETEADV